MICYLALMQADKDLWAISVCQARFPRRYLAGDGYQIEDIAKDHAVYFGRRIKIARLRIADIIGQAIAAPRGISGLAPSRIRSAGPRSRRYQVRRFSRIRMVGKLAPPSKMKTDVSREESTTAPTAKAKYHYSKWYRRDRCTESDGPRLQCAK